MACLYEINEEILKLTEQIKVDEATGECLGDIDNICLEINRLQMEKKEICVYLAKCVLNYRVEMDVLKAEEQRLKKRRDTLAKKTEKFMNILSRECGGKTSDLGIATASYRKVSRLDVDDEGKAVRWLKDNNYLDCYHVSNPVVTKSKVAQLIKTGVEVPGCKVVNGYSFSLK